MAQTESKANTKKEVRMWWGLSLDAWNNLIVAALALGGLIAVFGGVSTYISFQLQKQEVRDSKEALEGFKRGEDAKVADAKIAGIEAGKAAGGAILKAAEANERAATLEKEAKEARLETEHLKNANLLMQRSVGPRQIDGAVFLKALEGTPKPKGVIIVYSDMASDGWYVASQISMLLEEVGWPLLNSNGTKLPYSDRTFELAGSAFGFAAPNSGIMIPSSGVRILSNEGGGEHPIADALLTAVANTLGTTGGGGRDNTLERGVVKIVINARP